MSYNDIEYQIVATLFRAGVLNKYNVLNFGSTMTFTVVSAYRYLSALSMTTELRQCQHDIFLIDTNAHFCAVFLLQNTLVC